MGWIVVLVKPTTGYLFHPGYFPRKFHYKRDAEELKRVVESNGGQAEVKPAK